MRHILLVLMLGLVCVLTTMQIMISTTQATEISHIPTSLKNITSRVYSPCEIESIRKLKRLDDILGKVQETRTETSEESREPANKETVSEDEEEVRNDLFYSAPYFMQMGELYDDEWRYTWYSENVLPGGGLDIPGRHVDGEGYVVDSEERLVAASEDIPYGTKINVPFGSGVAVVRDCGCPSGTIDIYVSW